MNNISSTSRPRTPSRSPAPPTSPPQPPIPTSLPDEDAKPPQRKSSFSFLRRSKSTEKLNGSVRRTVSSGKLQKKSKQGSPADAPPAVPAQPPKIPDIIAQPRLQEFGGDSAKGRSTVPYNIPIPRVPAHLEEMNSKSESMTHRGRYSYASSAVSTLNGPRRVRRRKDPTPFNILVVGAKNSGKSSFGEFLRASLTLPPRKQRPSFYPDEEPSRPNLNPNFSSEYIETEMAGERIGLTIWDSDGLEKNMVDLQLRDIVTFIESKFEDTLAEETKVIRTPGAKDTHIHCVILLLDPINLNKTVLDAKKLQLAALKGDLTNGKSVLTDFSSETINALDEDMDLQVVRALQGKTTVIPLISKADTLPTEQMKFLKRSVYRQLKVAKLDPFEALGLDDLEDDSEEDSDSDGQGYKRTAENGAIQSHFDSDSSSDTSVVHTRNGTTKQAADALPPLPLSVLTPDPISAHQAMIGMTGREFPWGSADPYDPKHCDFVALKKAIFQEWFAELKEASRELWYEGWRTSRLDAPRSRPVALFPSPHEPAPKLPVLATNGQAIASTPQARAGPSTRNVSGGISPSFSHPYSASQQTSTRDSPGPQRPITQFPRYIPSQEQLTPASAVNPASQRNSPQPQAYSANTVNSASQRNSPQPLAHRLSPQPSQNAFQRQQSPMQKLPLQQSPMQQSPPQHNQAVFNKPVVVQQSYSRGQLSPQQFRQQQQQQQQLQPSQLGGRAGNVDVQEVGVAR